jgi:hypothetical protein
MKNNLADAVFSADLITFDSLNSLPYPCEDITVISFMAQSRYGEIVKHFIKIWRDIRNEDYSKVKLPLTEFEISKSIFDCQECREMCQGLELVCGAERTHMITYLITHHQHELAACDIGYWVDVGHLELPEGLEL